MVFGKVPLAFDIFGLSFVEDGFEGTLDYLLTLVVFWRYFLLASHVLVRSLLLQLRLRFKIFLRTQKGFGIFFMSGLRANKASNTILAYVKFNFEGRRWILLI